MPRTVTGPPVNELDIPSREGSAALALLAVHQTSGRELRRGTPVHGLWTARAGTAHHARPMDMDQRRRVKTYLVGVALGVVLLVLMRGRCPMLSGPPPPTEAPPTAPTAPPVPGR